MFTARFFLVYLPNFLFLPCKVPVVASGVAMWELVSLLPTQPRIMVERNGTLRCHQKYSMKALLTATLLTTTIVASAASISVGAAPSGNAAKVASKIIKKNFPACKLIHGAKRLQDGTIAASCDGSMFRVFTMFNPQEGRVVELALNCTAAKQLNISC